MKFCNSNPFVRYAMAIQIFNSTEYSSSYDCRLFYVLSGKALLHINNEEYNLSANNVLLWPSGCIYKFETEKPLKMIAVNFDYTYSNCNITDSISTVCISDFDKNCTLENIDFDDADVLSKPLIISGAGEFKENIKRIVNVFTKREAYFSERCSALLKDLIIDILQNSMFASTSVLGKIETVIKYIQDNYSESISNEDIAKTVSYHPYHLNKLMLKYTGLTLHKYLLNYRLEKAKEYLLNKTYSVSSIAEMCGFSSSYHLTNAFKQKYGCSPSKYRSAYINLP